MRKYQFTKQAAKSFVSKRVYADLCKLLYEFHITVIKNYEIYIIVIKIRKLTRNYEIYPNKLFKSSVT